jgi:uncharacterized protein (DUF1810 family)
MSSDYALGRFKIAQDEDGTYTRALAELRAGRKQGHWMWFVFPQLAGLGQSAMSRTYAISSLAEARAYLHHPVLGRRLIECTRILAGLEGRTAHDVFGSIDAMKLHSSITLFMHASPDDALFRDVLARYFDGAADQATERLLRAGGTA